MKTLHSIRTDSVDPVSGSTTFALHGTCDGTPLVLAITDDELACSIDRLLNTLCDDYHAATIEPAGNIVVDASTQRAVFAVTLTSRSEDPKNTTSEQLTPHVRDAMPELWAAAEREFSAEKKNK